MGDVLRERFLQARAQLREGDRAVARAKALLHQRQSLLTQYQEQQRQGIAEAEAQLRRQHTELERVRAGGGREAHRGQHTCLHCGRVLKTATHLRVHSRSHAAAAGTTARAVETSAAAKPATQPPVSPPAGRTPWTCTHCHSRGNRSRVGCSACNRPPPPLEAAPTTTAFAQLKL